MKFRIETAVRANKEIPQEKNVSFLANMFSVVLLLSVLFVGGIVHKYILKKPDLFHINIIKQQIKNWFRENK